MRGLIFLTVIMLVVSVLAYGQINQAKKKYNTEIIYNIVDGKYAYLVSRMTMTDKGYELLLKTDKKHRHLYRP